MATLGTFLDTTQRTRRTSTAMDASARAARRRQLQALCKPVSAGSKASPT